MIALLVAAAAAAGDIQCHPGEELARLEGVDERIMSFIYHRGYLVQNIHSRSANVVWDLADPRSPVQVRSYDDAVDPDVGWSGHHVATFVGETAILNWGGTSRSQLDLSAMPDLRTAAPVYHSIDSEHENTYYPLGFRGTPKSYNYEQVGDLTIHDMRDPEVQRIGRAWEAHEAGDSQAWESWGRDAVMPELGRIPVLSQTGFEGRANMIGNLLLVTGDNEMPQGVAAYDISDPSTPVLLDTIRTTADGQPLIKAYDSIPVWGSYVILAQNGDTTAQRGVDIVDFSDPGNLRHVGRFEYPGNTRYAQFQDEYMFVGDAKVNMHTFAVEQVFPDAGGEYSLPVGNLLVTAGLARPETGRVWCQQAAADTRPPEVLFHSPGADQVGVSVRGRVGLVIPETLDLSTVNADNIYLQDVDGQRVAAHLVLSDHDVLNLTPERVLDEQATYELVMPAGGLADVSGNALEQDFRFRFSTGDALHRAPPPEITRLRLSDAVADVGEPVRLSVAARGRQIAYRVDWGDGGGEGSFSGSRSAEHTYAAPGMYPVRVQARSASGDVSSLSVRVVVREPGAQARASSTIGVDRARGRVWVANPDNDTVTAVGADGAVLREVSVPSDPRGVAVGASGEVWVVSHDEPAVTVLSPGGDELARLALPRGSRPSAILLSPDGEHAYVSGMGSASLYRVDVAQRALRDTLPVGPWPRAMALSADGQTLLATRLVSPAGQGEVYRVDTRTFDAFKTIVLPADTTTVDTDRVGRGVPNYLLAVAISPDGDSAWVGAKKDNTLRGAARDGLALTFETTLRSMIATIDLRDDTERLDERVDIDNHELVSGIAFSEDGNLAYVSHQGNRSLTALDATTRQVVDRIELGEAPVGVAVHGREVFVHSFLSRALHRVSIFTGTAGTVGALAVTGETALVGSETLPEAVLAGKRLFYSAADPRISRDGYLSCASCHLDGESDGRVWDFTDRGEGLRNTASLRSGGGGRLHWSANFDEVQDFEHDIRGPFGGTGLMADSLFAAAAHPLGEPKAGRSPELDALAAYVGSLSGHDSPHRQPDGALTEAGSRGAVVFASEGCGECHSGARFSDSAEGVRRDVGTLASTSGGRLGGTLSGLDTPALRGLWASAPYLHDGSAGSIREALQHGATGTLSEREEADLVAFLQQIEHDSEAPAWDGGPTVTSPEDGAAYGALSAIPLRLSEAAEGAVTWFVNDAPVSEEATAAWAPEFSGAYRVYARIQRGERAVLTPEVRVTVALDSTPPERDGFTLLWHDDFDVLDQKRWSSPRYVFDDSAALHTHQMVEVRGGLLRLKVEPTDALVLGERAFLTGELRTHETFTHGRFEARARFPGQPGVVSTFYTLYDYFSLPEETRLEDWNQLVVGGYGAQDEVSLSAVYWDEAGDWRAQEAGRPVDPAGAFHTYAIEWVPDAVRFYIDDVLVHEVTGEKAARFRHPSKLGMSLWPARDGAHIVDRTGPFEGVGESGTAAVYDWVRVYALSAAP